MKNGYDLNISELYSSALGIIKKELFLLRLSAHFPVTLENPMEIYSMMSLNACFYAISID